MINSIDSAEVSALLDMLLYGATFVGFIFGLILPKIFKLIILSVEFLSKKLGKDKKKQDKKSKKEEVEK